MHGSRKLVAVLLSAVQVVTLLMLLTAKVALASATTGPGNRQDVFIRGGDNALWQKTFDGNSWGHWISLGGFLTSDPASVVSASGRIDVFVRGGAFDFWQRTWDGTAWGPWTSLGGRWTSAPAVASQAPGTFDLFGAGVDGQIWQTSWNGTAWSAPHSLGGFATSNPAVVSWGPGRLDLFVRGGDNALWHKWSVAGSWSRWESLGGTLQSAPAAASYAAGRLDVFVHGGDSALWHKWFDGSNWGWWKSVGGDPTGDPSATASVGHRVDVYVRASDYSLNHRYWWGAGWSAWESLGGYVAAGNDPIVLNVPIYLQTMNLDCETAALQMGLKYLGHSYTQDQLFALENPDLTRPVLGSYPHILYWGDPYQRFVGNVNGTDAWPPTGYGIYYPPILSIAKSHGAAGATGGEGNSTTSIYKAIAYGHPVEVWVEVGWLRPYLGWWAPWGSTTPSIRYSLAEHTVVLTGLTATSVRVNDPWHGNQYWVSKSTFETSFADFNNMAVIFSS